MNMGLSDIEGRVLHGLVEDASGDIVVRLDADGFLLFASQNVVELGLDLASMLVMPHISDLATRDYAASLNNYVEQVLSGHQPSGWIEFPANGSAAQPANAFPDIARWFALSLRRIENDDGAASEGALGLIRSLDHARTLEGELNRAGVTDPLTGLANRHTFCARLERDLNLGEPAVVVVLAVDRMRALLMQYGQRAADEIMWGFAKFLEALVPPESELAQLDNERLAVILRGSHAGEARGWAREVLQTFSSLTLPASSRAPKLTASAGMARLECTVDWTLRQAELGLVMARAGGGMQVGQCGHGSAGVGVGRPAR